jgi:hypothetical protein
LVDGIPAGGGKIANLFLQCADVDYLWVGSERQGRVASV